MRCGGGGGGGGGGRGETDRKTSESLTLKFED